jgi:hypothetical protein
MLHTHIIPRRTRREENSPRATVATWECFSPAVSIPTPPAGDAGGLNSSAPARANCRNAPRTRRTPASLCIAVFRGGATTPACTHSSALNCNSAAAVELARWHVAADLPCAIFVLDFLPGVVGASAPVWTGERRSLSLQVLGRGTVRSGGHATHGQAARVTFFHPCHPGNPW